MGPLASSVALGLALGLTACAPSTHATGWQEIVTDVEFLPPPNLDNPVMFGESLHAFPGTRAKLMQAIAFQVSGHLPGTRFLVIRGPVLEPPGGEAAISYRTWGEGRPLAVLGWYPTAVASPFGPPGTIVLPGLWWEVAHIEWGTDDGGRHVPP